MHMRTGKYPGAKYNIFYSPLERHISPVVPYTHAHTFNQLCELVAERFVKWIPQEGFQSRREASSSSCL